MKTLEIPADFVCTAGAPDWLKLRRQGIGGSEAPTILGINAYQGPHDLWLQKLGEAEPEEAGEAAKWGNRLEPLILEQYTAETGRGLERVGSMYRCRSHGFLQATVDAIADFGAGELGVVQAKLTTRSADWADGLPDYVFAQLQHEMLATGLRRGSVAVLLSGTKFYYDDVPFDEAYCQDYLERAAAFWEAVTTRTPPALEPTDACGRALARFYGQESPGVTVQLPAEMVALDIRREEIGTETRGELFLLKQEKTGIDNEIKNAIGEAQYGMLPNGVRYKWGTVTRKAVCCPSCQYVLTGETSYRALTRSDKSK